MFNDREWRLAFKFVAVFFLFLLAIWLVINLAPIISIFVTAFLVVYSISPLVNFLVKKKIPPFIAAGAVSTSLMIIMITLLSLIIPTILTEFNYLMQYFATDFQIASIRLLNELDKIDTRFDLTLTENLMLYTTDFISQLPHYLQQAFTRLTTVFIALLTHIWGVMVMLLLIFYLVQDMEHVKKNFTRLFPLVYRQNIGRIISVIDEKVGAYIRGNIIRCTIVGILTWLALYLAGMPFSMMFGALAGAFNIILYVGPFIAAVPAVLISFTPATPHPLLIISIYIVVQIIDTIVLTPVLLGKTVNLRPLTIVVILLIGGQLLGFLGLILAIPVTATLKVLLFHHYPNLE